MKKLINKILRSANLQLVTCYSGTEPMNRLPDFENNLNVQIEFIGAPGVGKTTVARAYFERYKNSQRMLTRDFTFLSSVRKQYSIVPNIGDIYEQLLDLKVKEVASRQVSSEKKINSIVSLKNILIDDYLMNSISTNSHIVIDEGFVHNFGNILSDFEGTNPQAFAQVFQNRCLIYCKGSTKLIVQNLKTRSLTGKTIDYHKGLNEKEIFELTERSIQNKEILVNKLKQHHIKIIEIDPEQGLETNLKLIHDFINERSQK